MSTIFIQGIGFVMPDAISMRPNPSQAFRSFSWPRQVVRVGVFFHGGNGPLRVDGEALNDEPLSGAVAAAVAQLGALWVPTTSTVALQMIIADIRTAWRDAWYPDDPPQLTIEYTHRGPTSRPLRRARRVRVTTEAQWRAMSKDERRRHVRRRNAVKKEGR